jgi:hypothetical protein
MTGVSRRSSRSALLDPGKLPEGFVPSRSGTRGGDASFQGRRRSLDAKVRSRNQGLRLSVSQDVLDVTVELHLLA